MRTAAKVWNHFTRGQSSEAETETSEVTAVASAVGTSSPSIAMCRYCGSDVCADLVQMGAHLRSCEKCPASVRFKFSADRSERRPLRAPVTPAATALHTVPHPSHLSHSVHPALHQKHSVAAVLCPPNVSLTPASATDHQHQNQLQKHLDSAALPDSLLELMKRPLGNFSGSIQPRDLLASLEPLLKRARTDFQQARVEAAVRPSSRLAIEPSPAAADLCSTRATELSSGDANAEARAANPFSVERLLMASSHERDSCGDRERGRETLPRESHDRPSSALASLIGADRRLSSSATQRVLQRSQSLDPSELLSRAHESASASVSRTRSTASPSGVGGGEQQTGARSQCEIAARDHLPPRDRAGIWNTAAAPLGVTETTAPLTPIALRRALYSMLYRRVLGDLGLSLSSGYKCSSDCALELECGGGAIANSDSASSSGAQQKHTCRLLQLEHDYGSLAACVVDALECVRSARSPPQHNEALNAIVRCCERANLRLLRIAQFEPLRDRVLAVVARFLNFVEQLRSRLASLYARQMPASEDDLVELRSSTLGFLRSAVADLDAQLFSPLSRAIARLPRGTLSASDAALTEDACEDLQSMFANHVVNPCAMARSLPNAGSTSGARASQAGLSSASKDVALDAATGGFPSGRDTQLHSNASSLLAKRSRGFDCTSPGANASASARALSRAVRRFGKARIAAAFGLKLSSSSPPPPLNHSDDTLINRASELNAFALRSRSNKSRHTAVPASAHSSSNRKKSSLPTLESLRKNHHAPAHSRALNSASSPHNERTCSPVPSAVVAHFPAAPASTGSLSIASMAQQLQQAVAAGGAESALPFPNSLPSDAAAALSAGSGSGSAQSTHSLLHQINLRNLQNAISAISQAVSANGGVATHHSLPAATDTDPIHLIDAVAHALNALDSSQNGKALVASDVLPVATPETACVPTSTTTDACALQNQLFSGVSRPPQGSRHSTAPTISRSELLSSSPNAGDHKDRVASSNANAAAALASIRSILSVTKTDWRSGGLSMVSASAPAPLTLPLEEETPATPTQQTSSSGDDSGADDADGGDYRAADMEVASDADGDADLDQDLDVDEGVGVRGAEGDERDQLDWASAAGALAGSRAGQCPVLTGAAISAAAWNESEDAELYTLIQQFGKHSWGTIYKWCMERGILVGRTQSAMRDRWRRLVRNGALTDLEKQYGPLMHNPRASARSPLGPKSLAGHSTQRFKRSYSSLSPNMTLKAAAAAAALSASPKPVGAAIGSAAPTIHHSPPLSSAVVTAVGPQATVHHGAPVSASDPTLASTPSPASSPALTIASAESASVSSTANTRSNGVGVNAALASSAAPAIAASSAASAGASGSSFGHAPKASHHNHYSQPPPNVDVTHALARDLLALVASAAASTKNNNAAHDEEHPVDFSPSSSSGALLDSSAAASFSADALLSPALGLRPSKALLGKH